MKVDKIQTCICCEDSSNLSDSIYYGMPQLKVCDSYSKNGGQFYEVYCPNCGRGGLIQFKSSYLALKHWNYMQERIKRMKKYGLFIDD